MTFDIFKDVATLLVLFFNLLTIQKELGKLQLENIQIMRDFLCGVEMSLNITWERDGGLELCHVTFSQFLKLYLRQFLEGKTFTSEQMLQFFGGK